MQVACDPHRVISDPDPRSRAGYIRLVGYSPGAGFVITVIIVPMDFSGVSAWKTRGVTCAHTFSERTPPMSEPTSTDRRARQARHAAIRAEIAAEETEATEAEAAETGAALDVALHLRIDNDLDRQLRARADAEHIPTSALVRRLLRQAIQQPASALSPREVEQIARRVARDELQRQ